jgi:hypothetical protein
MIVNWKDHLKEICYNFYNNLYKAQKEVLGQTKLKHRVLDSMPKIFTNEFQIDTTDCCQIHDKGESSWAKWNSLGFYIFNGK